MTRPGVDIDLPRGILIPLQLIACLVLADLSYRFVELPFNGKAKLPRDAGGLAARRPPGAARSRCSAVILIVGWSGIVKAGQRWQPRGGGRLDQDRRPTSTRSCRKRGAGTEAPPERERRGR